MVHVITGAKHSGKTTLANDTVNTLKKEGIAVCGILSSAVIENDKYIGYDGVDIRSRERFPLLRKTGNDSSLKAGSFYFVPEGFERACGIIDKSSPDEVLVIDELGPAEIVDGKGFWQSAQKVLSEDRHVLAVVRKELLEKFSSLTEKSEVIVYNAGIDNAAEIADNVKSRIV